MSGKSRLGRGLGALFPSLPEENELEHSFGAQEPVEAPEPAQPVQQPAKPRSKAKPRKVAEPVSQPQESEEPEGPVSPLSSTIPSMGEMTRNAETVSRLSKPLTLTPEAAEHKLEVPAVSHETKKKSSSHKRAVMPSVAETAQHPSDMFFDGSPINPELAHTARQAAADGSTTQLKPVQGGYLMELDVKQIGPNLHQPRLTFNKGELEELAHSIEEVGVLQPIVVRKRPADQIEQARESHAEEPMTREYELVMGERRWRASQLAGLKTIPAIVKTTADDAMLRDALLENLHRVALNPLEEAAAYQQMIDEFGLTQKQLSQSVSKSRPQIANTLRLMNLPSEVQKHVVAGELSAGHARALLGLSTPEQMIKLADRIIKEGLSVRSVEEIVSLQSKDADGKPEHKHKLNRNNLWAGTPIQQNLEQRFATKVSIKGSEKHGRIEIVFSSPEEMERIVDQLMTVQAIAKQNAEANAQ
ncbi:chromosome partitioning protein ParB [Bifidobacterium dolichotidis]|uniref:Chromosome partitioning protein ParB n=1 Tax=Bifidobacterium dolichotidis TaxID=2306976 RepID=A0A430FNW4_9BIFI|nr:ParB/RepB/Spo0J family partition protein [Bifidobacterium dolichotidis]RSX54530.1 chromosome partitioning protein ParB [Bifidobacterium dolichotidis]